MEQEHFDFQCPKTKTSIWVDAMHSPPVDLEKVAGENKKAMKRLVARCTAFTLHALDSGEGGRLGHFGLEYSVYIPPTPEGEVILRMIYPFSNRLVISRVSAIPENRLEPPDKRIEQVLTLTLTVMVREMINAMAAMITLCVVHVPK